MNAEAVISAVAGAGAKNGHAIKVLVDAKKNVLEVDQKFGERNLCLIFF